MKSIQAVKIEKIVFKGLGLAHSNNETLFVQQTIPGDILDVNIINQKKNSILAEPKKFHQKSEYKSKAKCEVFGKCGGCDWLDVEYHHQLKLKRDMLVDLFSDIVDESAISEVIPSPQRTNYRNKVFQPVQKIDGKIEIGMFEKRSHKVIQHRNCYLQPDFFDKVFADVKEYLIKSNAKIYDEKNHQGNVRHLGIRNSKNNNEFILIIVTKNRKLAFTKQLVKSMTEKYPNLVGIVQNINSEKKNKILGDDEKLLFGRRFFIDELGNTQFEVNYDSFYQVNSQLTELLYSEIKKNISAEKVIDAYCGAGTISLFIADKAERIIGIDSNKSSIENAEKNSAINNIHHCRFVCSTVEEEFEKLSLDSADTIIFDPPRKGIDDSIMGKVINSDIGKIIYISCNPSTQKRDIMKLLDNGFVIEKFQPFDMFPQTWHIENLMILKRS